MSARWSSVWRAASATEVELLRRSQSPRTSMTGKLGSRAAGYVIGFKVGQSCGEPQQRTELLRRTMISTKPRPCYSRL
jgi:hypothetical protein